MFINSNASAANQPQADSHEPELQSSISGAQLLQDKIARAIEAFEASSLADFTYTVHRYENEEGDISSSIEHHDAQQPAPQRWKLLEINGDKPDKKQQRRFQQKIQKKKQNTEQHFTVKLQDVIKLNSVEPLHEDDQVLQVKFDVALEQFGDKASEKLQGQLFLNKSDNFIETIEINNTESFSPMFSANITELKLKFEFVRIDEDVLPFKNSMRLKGTWAFFTEIDEVSTDTWSGYIK